MILLFFHSHLLVPGGGGGLFLQIRTGDTGRFGSVIEWTAFSPFPKRGHGTVRIWHRMGRHFSLFRERRHADFALFTSKFSCPRNSPNGEFRGFSQVKNSGVELKQRIQRTEKPGFLRRFRLKTGLLKIIYKSLNSNEL